MGANYTVELIDKITGPAKAASSSVSGLQATFDKLRSKTVNVTVKVTEVKAGSSLAKLANGSNKQAGDPNGHLTPGFNKALSSHAAAMSAAEGKSASTFAQIIQGIGNTFGQRTAGRVLNVAKAATDLTDKLEPAMPALEGIGSAALAGASVAISGIMAIASAIATVTIAIAGLVTALGVMGAKFAAEMIGFKQDSLFSLQFFKGSKAAASTTFDDIDRLARATGMSTVEAMKGYQELISGGFKHNTAKQMVAAFADMRAISPGIDTNEVARQMGQIQGRGKVTMDNLRPIFDRIPVDDLFRQAVARQLKIKPTDVAKAIEQGKVSADVGNAALLEAVSLLGKNGGTNGSLGAIAQMKSNTTVSGTFDRVKAQAERLFMEISASTTQSGLISIGKVLERLLDPASDSGKRLLSNLNEIADAGGKIITWLSEIDLKGVFSDAAPYLDQIGPAITTTFEAVKTIGSTFMSSFSVAIGPLKSMLSALVGGTSDAQTMQVILRGVGTVLGVVAAAALYVGAAVGYMGYQAAEQFALFSGAVQTVVDVITGFVSLMTWAGEQLSNAFDMSMVMTSITSAFSGSDSWLVDAGQNILQGLANGISNGLGVAIGAITNAASQIKDAFTSSMQIASPSKVFAQYGGHLMTGIAQGVDNKSGVAQSAVDGAISPPSVTGTASSAGAAAMAAGAAKGSAPININVTIQGGSDSSVRASAEQGVRAGLLALLGDAGYQLQIKGA